jgi:hypothetical protein
LENSTKETKKFINECLKEVQADQQRKDFLEFNKPKIEAKWKKEAKKLYELKK